MKRLVRHVLEWRIARYLLASAGALAVDFACFLLLLPIMVPAAASAAGYCAGILAHWLISSRTVFSDGLRDRRSGRNRQKALFVMSALAGLAVTTGIVGLGDYLGVDPRLAKLIAVGASFYVTWLLRSRVVFRLAPA